MDRSIYNDLTGKRLPIASHLILHQQPDPDDVLVDGQRLAEVLVETARQLGSPMALPVMDLTLEKDIMLRALGIPEEEIPAFHFSELPEDSAIDKVAAMDVLESARIKASCEALTIIGQAHDAGATEIPVGMGIGPFSLLTKMLSDPITPIYMAGTGLEPEDDDEVALLYKTMELCELAVAATCRAQIEAGAKALIICEPAANLVYFSPNQLKQDFTVYNDLVIEPNKRLVAILEEAGVDFILHNCGELTPEMISSFAVLKPVIFSLGSPVKLWEAAEVLPPEIILMGNLPTKKFYSDEEVPLTSIPPMVNEIEDKLTAAGRDYIVSSECDVLSMPGYEDKIMEKVRLMVDCP